MQVAGSTFGLQVEKCTKEREREYSRVMVRWLGG